MGANSSLPEQTKLQDIPSRLTVNETVYYQEPGDPIYTYEARYSQRLKSKGVQPYERRLRATVDWQALDCGWISECSMLILSNEEGKFLHVLPTEEERREASNRIIELGFANVDGTTVPIWNVYPTTELRGCPRDLAPLRVRCLHSMARFTLILLPS